MTGTWINMAAIIAGAVLGMLAKKGIPRRVEESLTRIQGLAVGLIGLNGVIASMFTVDADGGISDSGGLLLLVSLVLQRRSGVLLLVLFMAPLLLARYSFKLYLDSRSLHIRTVACLSEAIEAKDPYTRGHSRRVAYYSEQIARALRLPGGTVYQIKVAALLHDVGKIGIDDAVLRKPGALTSAEYDQVKRHPEVGRRIIDSIHLPSTVTDGVLYHHHRFDGGGYPEEGPAPGELPLCPAILAVADCYDAMTSDRPYRSAMSREQAEAVLREVSGSQLDPRVVEAFLRILPDLDPGRASGDADLSLLLDPAGA